MSTRGDYSQPSPMAWKAIRLIEQGKLTPGEAIRVTRISRATVYRWLKANGVDYATARARYVQSLWTGKTK